MYVSEFELCEGKKIRICLHTYIKYTHTYMHMKYVHETCLSFDSVTKNVSVMAYRVCGCWHIQREGNFYMTKPTEISGVLGRNSGDIHYQSRKDKIPIPRKEGGK